MNDVIKIVENKLKKKRQIRIVCMSDTHRQHRAIPASLLPAGDIFIHAGDFTNVGDYEDIFDFNAWLGTLPYKHKVVIAGNHDWAFQRKPEVARSYITNAIYLEDTFTIIHGLKIYGSPWQPRFHNWAFNVDRGAAIREKWKLIPDDTDILVTHGPAFGFGDTIYEDWENLGCEDLYERILQVKPKVHVFGHIHGGYGVYENEDTVFVNAASCNEGYQPVNAPIMIELTDVGVVEEEDEPLPELPKKEEVEYKEFVAEQKEEVYPPPAKPVKVKQRKEDKPTNVDPTSFGVTPKLRASKDGTTPKNKRQ